MRQCTKNPSIEMCEKVKTMFIEVFIIPRVLIIDFVSKIWILLGLCIVAFLPSKALLKYLESFIRRNSQQSSISYLPFVDWCGERLRSSRVADRKMVYIFKACILLN